VENAPVIDWKHECAERQYTERVSTVGSFEIVGFLVGLLFGSFLNVCISRLPEHESVVKPRSRCPGCGHTIRWYDNVPVLSWIVLRARCRDCKSRISWRYPAVELAVGLWFAFRPSQFLYGVWQQHVYWDFARPRPADEAVAALTALSIAVLGFLLIGLMVMDWQTQRLPDAFTLTGIAIGFVLTCVQAAFLAPGEGDIALNPTHQWRMSSPGSFAARGNVFLTGTEAMVLGRVAAIAGAALILLMIRWAYKAARGHQGMGLGDVKLLAMIAAFLGFSGSLVALFVGVMAAMVYALVLLAMRRATAQSKLPFGSFLSVGGLFAAAAGHQIVDWYLGFWR
jgi:leader peptidase (prepilin peptidase)/N-methyltransferase